MSNYDFHALLEPLEFQELVCDIVQIRDDIFLETYKEGRDFGIDGMYTDDNKKIIVQAKRYQQDFKRLYYDLKHIELPKVQKLNPDRYILGVSVDFMPKEKDEIINLFEGYITSTSDILSKKDLNRLLREPAYKRIELAYPKLWLPSINVFEKTLKESVHRATYRESAEEFKEAIKKSKVFAPTKVYRKALHKWSQNHIIVLSGEPGVGKTTMAYLLALAYLQPDNLDGFVWANSISDVYTMFEDEQKQVFILDDFWGSIFHADQTRRNDEIRLEKLIRRIVESNGKKRLILTTREYILQQGLQKHPELKETLERYALICTMEEYSDDEKASILFRHLYASNLRYEYVDYLYTNCNWIVHHKNYNPRVLALFLDREPGKNVSPNEYYEELCDYFDNPGAFWKSIFVELSLESQIIAMLLLISSTPMRLIDMERCYQKYIHDCMDHTNVKNLGNCIAELEKTMIKSYYSEEEEAILLRFSMPAVQDFLYTHIQENSEQSIPLLLRCCVYYNQLQFILEYLSKYCSDRVVDLIVQQCILHYYDYDDSYIEYAENWNWNWKMDISDEPGCLHRFFHLLRCYEPERHHGLYLFLESEINDYCLTMGRGDLEAQYIDLHNLPSIIVRCVKKGMTFNGKDIIAKYYEEAFSAYHYGAMKEFKEVFPEDYNMFYNTYFQKIKRNLRNTILYEIEFLDDLGMDIGLDMLIDNIPNILKEFGLRYTKEFREKIIFLVGREPISLKREKTVFEKQYDYMDQEERELEVVKEDAKKWIFGPNETYLNDDQIVEIISQSSLNLSQKAELKKVFDSRSPHYFYNLLMTKESIELLFGALCNSRSHIPEKESSLIFIMLWYLGQGDHELLKKLIGFCAESFTMIMYQEEPVLRTSQFLSGEIFESYLKNNAQLSEVVFENLIIRDEQWVRFLHIPLFIFCNAFIMIMGCENSELEEYYQDLWGENFNKLKHIVRYDGESQTNVYYADIGTYKFKRYEWEGCMYRMFEEIDPFQFNQVYVEPMLKRYLDELGNGDDDSKVLKHVALCGVQIEYDEVGVPYSWCCEISDELSLIDNLAIAEGWDTFPRKMKKSRLKQLQKDETICKKDKNKWRILLYKIEDVELLKELGSYNEILRFVEELENTYSRFLNGDYSLTKKLS